MNKKLFVNITFSFQLPKGMTLTEAQKAQLGFGAQAFLQWHLNEWVIRKTGIKNWFGESPMQIERETIHESEIH